MEDMAVVVSCGYDGESNPNPEQYESQEKKLRLDYSVDQYEPQEKKPRLDQERFDAYASENEDNEDDDVSSLDSSDCEYGPGGNKLSVEEMKKIKRETKKKFKAWSTTIKPEDTEAFFDVTDACILHADKSMIANPSLLHNLNDLSRTCRHRMTIYTFTYPGDNDPELDGGGTRVYECSELGDLELQRLSTKACKVIQQYNDAVINKDSNSKLEFVSFIRSAYIFPYSFYITFIARQNGNGQIGTYQAALFDDFFGDEVQLVLLRHVEADKILAILSLSGAEEVVW